MSPHHPPEEQGPGHASAAGLQRAPAEPRQAADRGYEGKPWGVKGGPKVVVMVEVQGLTINGQQY